MVEGTGMCACVCVNTDTPQTMTCASLCLLWSQSKTKFSNNK